MKFDDLKEELLSLVHQFEIEVSEIDENTNEVYLPETEEKFVMDGYMNLFRSINGFYNEFIDVLDDSVPIDYFTDESIDEDFHYCKGQCCCGGCDEDCDCQCDCDCDGNCQCDCDGNCECNCECDEEQGCHKCACKE